MFIVHNALLRPIKEVQDEVSCPNVYINRLLFLHLLPTEIWCLRQGCEPCSQWDTRPCNDFQEKFEAPAYFSCD
jgi:hypothetical protein